MLKDKITAFILGIAAGLAGLAILGFLLFQIPAVQDRYAWRVDFALTFLRTLADPVKPMPTVVAAQITALPTDPPTVTPTATATVDAVGTAAAETPTITPTAEPTFTPTPLPQQVKLPAPKYEKQEVNNCGPTTLALHLRFYGWSGDQATIAGLIKPKREDRNVNVEELVSYVNTEVPGLEIQYRVGGDVETLKRLLAAGFPVTIEEAFIMAESYWLNDDRWSGHYLLLTGYDDATQKFLAQDVFVGPNLEVAYQTLDKNWKAFNRVYILVYPTDARATVQSILGDQWDPAVNRQHALDMAQAETEKDPTDSFAWFNLGTNLVYFEKYSLAASAYDNARNIGLPQRMLRYQFGPFFTYFHTGRIDDLIALTDYALKRTPTSEEAMLWKGWALYRQGMKEDALNSFQEALNARPGYSDAQYALDFVQQN